MCFRRFVFTLSPSGSRALREQRRRRGQPSSGITDRWEKLPARHVMLCSRRPAECKRGEWKRGKKGLLCVRTQPTIPFSIHPNLLYVTEIQVRIDSAFSSLKNQTGRSSALDSTFRLTKSLCAWLSDKVFNLNTSHRRLTQNLQQIQALIDSFCNKDLSTLLTEWAVSALQIVLSVFKLVFKWTVSGKMTQWWKVHS